MPQRVHACSSRHAELSCERKKNLKFWMIFGLKSPELIRLIFGWFFGKVSLSCIALVWKELIVASKFIDANRKWLKRNNHVLSSIPWLTELISIPSTSRNWNSIPLDWRNWNPIPLISGNWMKRTGIFFKLLMY